MYRILNPPLLKTSVLGPLFSLLINDLPKICPSNMVCELYADDAVLFIYAKNNQEAGYTSVIA